MFGFDFLAILLLAALAFPVIAIVALVMTISLRDPVRRLDARLAKLEREFANREAAPARAAAVTAPEPAHRRHRTSRRRPRCRRRPESQAVASPAPLPSAPPPSPPPGPTSVPRCRPQRRQRSEPSVSRNGSAPAGWCGSAVWRSRSAAYFWCATRSSKGSSAPPSGSRWARCWRSSSSPSANGRVAAKKCRDFPACRRRIFPASSRRRAPPWLTRPFMPLTRFTDSCRRRSPSFCSASSRC